jgi:hypothetical protein
VENNIFLIVIGPKFDKEASQKAKKKYKCVYCHMSKKSRVGFLLSAKPEIVDP